MKNRRLPAVSRYLNRVQQVLPLSATTSIIAAFRFAQNGTRPSIRELAESLRRIYRRKAGAWFPQKGGN